MRFIDVSTAAAIALISSGVILSWSPAPYQSAAIRYQAETRLRQLLVKVVADLGLPWFEQSITGDVCSTISQRSNSSLTVTAIVDGQPCSQGPPSGDPSANITLSLPDREVTLEAWYGAGR